MGVKAWRGRLLLDEFDFSLDTFGATLELTVESEKSDNWQSTAGQLFPTENGAMLTTTGYYTGPDAGDIYQEMKARRGTETPAWVAWLFDTSALGNPAAVLDSAWASNIVLDTPVKGLIKFNAKWEGVAYNGLTLLDGAVVAIGNGTVITLPAAGSAGGMAFLLVRAIDGTAVDAQVSIECDSVVGMSTPTDKGAIQFSAVGVYELALTGTVEEYVRVVIDDLGGAAGFTAALVLCVDGVTQ